MSVGRVTLPSSLPEAQQLIADLTRRHEALEHVLLEVMAERDRAVGELERLSQLSLTEPA